MRDVRLPNRIMYPGLRALGAFIQCAMSVHFIAAPLTYLRLCARGLPGNPALKWFRGTVDSATRAHIVNADALYAERCISSSTSASNFHLTSSRRLGLARPCVAAKSRDFHSPVPPRPPVCCELLPRYSLRSSILVPATTAHVPDPALSRGAAEIHDPRTLIVLSSVPARNLKMCAASGRCLVSPSMTILSTRAGRARSTMARGEEEDMGVQERWITMTTALTSSLSSPHLARCPIRPQGGSAATAAQHHIASYLLIAVSITRPQTRAEHTAARRLSRIQVGTTATRAALEDELDGDGIYDRDRSTPDIIAFSALRQR
ncbi:hypothetical protein B0H17DRAFT_1190108 [Mycena rosella]|uniref:Uncharacterized protein n=1 Tax=Mycena rosella TaxID=1033263 RepID=A0AAD7H2D5_MYCRO|nr:hypothetical protein B0H17DRAFT_1190108 [Mycena rosella]